MKNAVTILAVALGSSAATAVDDYLTKTLHVAPLLAVICAAVGGVIVYQSLDWLASLLTRISLLRSLLDSRSLFEGYWISVTNKNNAKYYNLISLFYVPTSKDYAITGLSLDPAGNIYATWSGSDLAFTKSRLKFFYGAALMTQGAEEILGFSVINFHRTGSGSYSTGEGHIVDSGSNCAKYPIMLNRLKRSEIEKLLGKKDPETQGERHDLIKKYISTHPDF